MTVRHVVVVPSTPALLPQHAGLEDPVAELRAAVDAAVGWLVERHPDEVAVLCADARPDNVARGMTESAGGRIARELLSAVGFQGRLVDGAAGLLVIANGTACRSEKAPGHLDDRSFAYDRDIEEALRSGCPEALRALDPTLGESLWTYDVPALRELGAQASVVSSSEVDYADDPHGVQYWVVRWTCGS